MAAYAGKTKLPQGDIFDVLEGGRYFGPARGVGIGLGAGLGLEALFSKKTGKEKIEEEKIEEEKPNPDDFETKKEWGKAYREWWEKKKKTLPKQDPDGDWVVLDPEGREDSRWRTEEEAEAERQFWEDNPNDLLGYSVKNVKEKADYSFDLPKHTQEILDDLREKFGDKEADALEEKIRLGIRSETKHAQGGLVGVNYLTRSL
jgi:hypothetical protein